MTLLGDLQLDYRVAFLRYSGHGEEAALRAGYELGRSAVARGVSILDVSQVHHRVFLEALRGARDEDLSQVVAAASEFFLEVLATYDMTQRALLPLGPDPGVPPTKSDLDALGSPA